MNPRDAILGKIRRSLGVDAADPGRNATVDERLRRAPRGIVPARGQLGDTERVALFIAKAEGAAASVVRIADAAAIPVAVAEYLRAQNLPATIRLGDDPLLAGLAWEKTAITLKRGPSDGNDPIGLSHAAAAVAESGTLVLTSGSDNPTTVNFLPETHIVVVEAADVAGDYETVWASLRDRYGKGTLPRTVNWITGPSRSGDIEQKILHGAHGPRRLHIVVVG